MSNIYYNAHTHADAPRKMFTGAEVMDPSDPFMFFANREAKQSREEAMQATFAGSVYWREGDTMCRGYLRQAWEFKPVTNAETDWGINWGDCYAVTLDKLVEYVMAEFPDADAEAVRKAAKPTEYGLYTVHIHYDGRV